MRLERLKMKTTTIFTDNDGIEIINKKIMHHKINKKTAESCGYLFFLITFAKRLKIKELWQKSKRQS